MAAFNAEVASPPQVTEGPESAYVIVQGGEAAAVTPGEPQKPRVITSKARVVRK